MLASIIYNHGKFCDDFKSTLKLGAYGRTGALAAGAVTEQVEGGHEVSQAAYLAYESSRPVTGTASKGAALFRKKAAAEAKKRIKKVEAGKKLAKKTAQDIRIAFEKRW